MACKILFNQSTLIKHYRAITHSYLYIGEAGSTELQLRLSVHFFFAIKRVMFDGWGIKYK